MNINHLKFKDGIIAIFANRDRKHHLIQLQGEIITISNQYFSGEDKFIFRTMKVTYEYWKNRWGS